VKKFDRVIKLQRYLVSRRTPATMQQILDQLECSRPTAVRVLAEMRNTFNMPLNYIHGRGYALNETDDN